MRSGHGKDGSLRNCIWLGLQQHRRLKDQRREAKLFLEALLTGTIKDAGKGLLLIRHRLR